MFFFVALVARQAVGRDFNLKPTPAAAYSESAKESMNTDYDGGWKEALAVAFRRQVIQYEAEKSMPYVISTERLARAQGRQEDMLDILQARFNDVPYALCEQVKAIHDENALRECLRDAALLPTLHAFQAKLRR